MKTRQPTVNGITPLLIRKVSRGIKPVSTLMKQINNQCNKLPHTNTEIVNEFVQKENSFISGSDNLFENDFHEKKVYLKIQKYNQNCIIKNRLFIWKYKNLLFTGY